MKIKKILVPQPQPDNEKSPYHELAKKNNLQIDFRPFIHVEEVSGKDFRNSKINILEHTAVVFNSRTAVDHFFRICKELRLTIPDTMKYFCISEATAFYLQKYITYRKRKVFYGNGKMDDLMELIVKHKAETFLVPVSDIHNQEIPDLFDTAKVKYTKAILYRTVASDMKDILQNNYDIMVFFSPSGIASLKQNFPDFEQNETIIASFGPTTAKAVENAGLRLDIKAPTEQAPSMAMALEQFIKQHNKDITKKGK